jgi:hypothetical protein
MQNKETRRTNGWSWGQNSIDFKTSNDEQIIER